MSHDVRGARVLDLGCGEGKNAAAFAQAGAFVHAIDCSKLAVANGRRTFSDTRISWQVEDVAKLSLSEANYDYVIMYGVTHCLPNSRAIENLVSNAVKSTKAAGYHLLVAFNSRSQDLENAHPGFHPTLISHDDYLKLYAGLILEHASDTDLRESHPHNGITHKHSITRMIVRVSH